MTASSDTSSFLRHLRNMAVGILDTFSIYSRSPFLRYFQRSIPNLTGIEAAAQVRHNRERTTLACRANSCVTWGTYRCVEALAFTRTRTSDAKNR